MTNQSKQALKNNDVEVMLVSKDLANEVRDLKAKLKTSSIDVIKAGLELLKSSLNKEIILREPQSGKETKITALTNIDS